MFDRVVIDGGHLAMALNRPLATKHLTFTAVFEPAEEGGYVVTFPAIPNLATQGETLDEARAMAQDCLRCYLGGLSADGLPLPDGEAPREAVREAITVDLEAA
jgi:antitoxin HicB